MKFSERVKKNCLLFNIAIKEHEHLDREKLREKGFNYLGAHLRSTKNVDDSWSLKCKQSQKRLDSWKSQRMNSTLESLFKSREEHLRCTARECASIIGKILWRNTLSFLPGAEVYAVVDILRTLPRHSWDSEINLDTRSTRVLTTAWQKVLANTMHDCLEECPSNAKQYYVCTDSCDDGYGWVHFSEGGEYIRKTETTFWWNPVWRKRHIFLKEARAACLGVNSVLKHIKEPATIVVGIDNSAVAASLKRGFSSNSIANEEYRELFAKLREKKCILLVVGIPGLLNAADPASRGSSLAQWHDKELASKSWTALNDALKGFRYSGSDLRSWHRNEKQSAAIPTTRHVAPMDEEVEVEAWTNGEVSDDIAHVLADDDIVCHG